jgi:hypothetical protein
LFIFVERVVILNKPLFSPNSLFSEDLIDACLKHLEELLGIQARVNLVPDADNSDAMLDLAAEQSLQRETYVCLVKKGILKTSLGTVIAHLVQ